MPTDQEKDDEIDPIKDLVQVTRENCHRQLSESSYGRIERVEYYEDEAKNIRRRIVRCDKFDRETQLIFLTEFAKHGRKVSAARVAGISVGLVEAHLRRDPAFEEAYAFALECYRDKLDDHVQNLIFNGYEREKYDRDGNLVSVEKTFPEKLIIKEKEKHDEGWRSHRKVDVNVTGGVMVAPASPQTEDEWEEQFGETLDGSAEEL